MSSVLEAPELPEGYRFEVVAEKTYCRVNLQKRDSFWGFVSWSDIDWEITGTPTAYNVLLEMQQLKSRLLYEGEHQKFAGIYPPRKAIEWGS